MTARAWLYFVVLAAVIAGGAATGTAYAAVVATDSATNEPYATSGEWNLGDNGGSGYGAWTQTGDSAPIRSIVDGDFMVAYDGGLGRTLDIPQVIGSLEVEAVHGFTSKFSGFAVYGATGNEYFRVGVTTTEDTETGREDISGYWYSTTGNASGRNDYVLISQAVAEDITSARVEYSLTWALTGSTYEFDVAISSGGTRFASVSGLEVSASTAISAVGVLIAGPSTSDTMRFNQMTVNGTIPEPATMALLALGALALAARRR